MKYHPVTQKIIDLLEINQSEYELYEHKPVKTSQEADEVRPNFSSKQGAKAIVVKARYAEEKDKFVMLVLPGNLRFDNSKVRDLLKAQDYRFADKEEIAKETDGIKIGGIPPFGNLFDMQVYADPKILQNEKIIFNAGDRRISIAMQANDWQEIVNPSIVEIT